MSLCVAKSFDVPDHPYIVHLVESNCDIISLRTLRANPILAGRSGPYAEPRVASRVIGIFPFDHLRSFDRAGSIPDLITWPADRRSHRRGHRLRALESGVSSAPPGLRRSHAISNPPGCNLKWPRQVELKLSNTYETLKYLVRVSASTLK